MHRGFVFRNCNTLRTHLDRWEYLWATAHEEVAHHYQEHECHLVLPASLSRYAQYLGVNISIVSPGSPSDLVLSWRLFRDTPRWALLDNLLKEAWSLLFAASLISSVAFGASCHGRYHTHPYIKSHFVSGTLKKLTTKGRDLSSLVYCQRFHWKLKIVPEVIKGIDQKPRCVLMVQLDCSAKL